LCLVDPEALSYAKKEFEAHPEDILLLREDFKEGHAKIFRLMKRMAEQAREAI
jgi:hypothetical protein